MMRDRQLLPKEVSATDGANMYETNFGFHRQPFQCADLARAFFVSESIRSILPQLLHTLRSDLGIAVLTGSAGVGKTSLLKHLQSLLAHDGRTIMCSGASLETVAEVQQILQASSQQRAGDVNVELPPVRPQRNRWSVIEQMRKSTEFWGPVLLLIDDAQLLSVPVLNELRAFTEEEWNGRSLVRCLIAAPLSFEEELARPTHADFSHRIRCHAFLQPLSSKESIEFLRRHLEVVGGKLGGVFEQSAIELVASACDGLPRCLSLLADESLIVAAESSLKIVTADHVQKALSRLQHLPYPWAISPFRSESDDVAVLDAVPRVTETKPAVRTTLPSAGETHRSVGVVEFGSPGIIEVGAPSVTPKSVSVLAEIEIPAAAVTFIDVGESSSTDEIRPADQVSAFVDEGVSHSENTHDRMPFLASTSATAIADQHTFEVGHRYIPDALECTDAVDMEDCSPSASHDSSDAPGVGDSESIWPVVSTHSLHGQSKSHTTATASLNLPDAAPIVEIHAVPVVEFVSGSTADSMQGSVEDSQTGSTRRPSESELSVRQPVFDRYTWIELGREVPAGTNSAALTGTLGTVADISSQNALQNLTTDFSATQSTTFDKIPMRHTSDSEILSSLTQHSANTDHGVFVMFNGHGLTRTSASEHVSTESSGAETARKSVHVSAVGDEQFGIRIHDKLAQVRSSILSSDSDEADGVADKEESSASWMDGKLIFGDTETSAVEAEAAIETDTSATMSDDDSAVDAGSVSLSFEAAKAARDEHGGASGETAEVAKLRRKFFSLPEDVKTIEWDLRSSLIGCDEVSPLANSLAALQHEVTSFQQGGRITGKTDAGPEAEAGSSTASPQTAADPQSLVGRARRRLDTSESDLRTVERDSSTRLPSAAVPNDLITAVTSVPDETSDETLRPYGASRASISKASASGMQVGRTAMVNESDSVMADNAAVASLPPVRGLGQLFTRLRQVRRESGENQ